MLATTPLARERFALAAGTTYLNHAAVGVLPVATRDALIACVNDHAARGVLGIVAPEAALPAIRAACGRFIGAPDGTGVALLRNTTDGATLLARGLPFAAGDEIVTNRNEFGANAYPWLALGDRGVHVRFVDAPRERMTPAVLARTMTARTKLVAVSWVGFDDGYRHDLAGLAEVAHARGALIAVDAIQGLGAFPLDVAATGVDAVFSGGAKWLMATQGSGFLWVRPALLDRIATSLKGWRSVADIWNFLDYDQPLAPDGSRYEGGTPNLLGALALGTSLGVLGDADGHAIAAHVLALTDRLVEGAARRGWSVRGERGPAVSSGIVTLHRDGVDPIALGRRLGADGFIVTFRPGGLRVSPHGYNTAAEIDAFLDALP